jgi:ubiquinone/menaquinone biosynthesis C-methylase UbiE
MDTTDKQTATQQRYYAQTATRYDAMHLGDVEHVFALRFLLATLDQFGFNSVLDVGSGTGRVVSFIKEQRPNTRIIGVEPVKRLREMGHAKGISEGELVEGDATRLTFGSGEFDLVCVFGVLHHVRRPAIAVSEMLRVARRAIFISDSNNFGQGSFLARSLKQLIDAVGMWKVADFVKTKGRGYTISEGDGLAYSYSVFNQYRQIRKKCCSIHILNTMNGGVNPYRSAGHVALLALKKQDD